MGMKGHEESFDCEGIVCPWGWDKEGNVRDVLISAKDEQNFYVVMDEKGLELIACCGRRVSAKAVLERESKPKRVRLLSFREMGFAER